MDTPSSPSTPPSQFPSSHPAPKKGIGTGAKIGIGCGGVVLLAFIGVIVAIVMLGDSLKTFFNEAEKNPTRAIATVMVAGGGTMVAEDDVNKRYTVKDAKTGDLTTVYWSDAKKAPEVVKGDFSAIPATPPATTTGAEPEPVPAAPKE